MRVSVVIPTYNRAEILRQTLEAYSRQSGDHRILEILVVDDGSTDHTESVTRECAALGIPIRYLRQANSGQAAARNYAVREAKGDLILFGDDDIVPSPQMTAEHVRWHRLHPAESSGLLGFVDWLPSVRPTPFMKWSGLYGPQFNYGYFTAGQQLGFEYAYSCNTSVHASFLRKHGVFSEAFRTYGYEDVELFYRLSQQGFNLFYSATAIGYHNKRETLGDAQRRIEKLYASWPEFAKTAAGQEFLDLWRSSKSSRPAASKAWIKRVLAPMKSLAIPALRPLVDTRIPMPRWVYEQVFYHRITSFATIVERTAPASHAA